MNVDKFPGHRFGPDGQNEIFQREEDVPDGWSDNPNDFAPKVEEKREPGVPPAVSKYDGVAKDDLVKDLEGRQPKITFNKNWPEKKLIQLLEADDKKKA